MTPPPATAAAADWTLRWERLAETSPQLRTLAAQPERWRRFYDRVAPVWDAVTAGVDGLGSRIAAFAGDRKLLRPGDEVIEVGCGAGSLALAMANHRALVTAVDSSPRMIDVLQGRPQQLSPQAVTAAVADWRRLRSVRAFDVAVACCVPDALSPDGLRALDGLSHRECLVVLGHGNDAFPLRRRIWRRAMSEPLPPPGRLLPLVVGALEAMDRRPYRQPLSWPTRLDVAAADARAFFEAYFDTLGCTGDRLRKAIDDVIEPLVVDGRVRCAGRIDLVAVWWRTGASHAAGEAVAG